jgi:hypothetical protein
MREVIRLNKKLISNKAEYIYIIYDNNISPPAHGDFMNMFMLARFYSKKGFNTCFVTIIQENNFWKNFSDNAIQRFLDFQNKCFKSFDSENISTYSYRWDDFFYLFYKKDKIILFEDNVFNKLPIVKNAFNFLNLLTKNENSLFLDSWRLKSFFNNNIESFSKQDYITCNIRYSNILPELNNSENQVIEIYNFLSNKFPNNKILILSDKIGTDFVREIACKEKFKLYYSKDIQGNDSYIDDANLVLGSRFYFQLSGGGMSTVAFFSNVPYLIYQKPSFEKESFRLGLNWALDNQKFTVLDHWSPSDLSFLWNK